MKATYHKITKVFLGNVSEPEETELIAVLDFALEGDFYKAIYDEKTKTFLEGGTDEELQKYQEEKEKEKKQYQFEELSKTDWYVTRFLETGIPIPQEIIEQRNNIRNLSK